MASYIAYSAIGVTHPADIQLKPGESDRFKFELQAVSHPNDLECTYSLDTRDMFSITFDQESPALIEAGGIFLITGAVRVNETIEPGIYSRNIEVSCKDMINASQNSGSPAVGVYTIFINVQVVGERTRENINVPEPEAEQSLLTLTNIIAIVAILAALIIILLLIRRRKKRP